MESSFEIALLIIIKNEKAGKMFTVVTPND